MDPSKLILNETYSFYLNPVSTNPQRITRIDAKLSKITVDRLNNTILTLRNAEGYDDSNIPRPTQNELTLPLSSVERIIVPNDNNDDSSALGSASSASSNYGGRRRRRSKRKSRKSRKSRRARKTKRRH